MFSVGRLVSQNFDTFTSTHTRESIVAFFQYSETKTRKKLDITHTLHTFAKQWIY